MHTGMKFEIPFDQLVVFSTNIEPKELVDGHFCGEYDIKSKLTILLSNNIKKFP